MWEKHHEAALRHTENFENFKHVVKKDARFIKLNSHLLEEWWFDKVG
jgi:hypothetical protein